jgi:hypothetical protein
MPPPDHAAIRNPVPLRFELLTARHNEKVAPFDCDNPKITRWIKEDALEEMIAGKSSTYVALEKETGNENVVGYVAVRAVCIIYPPRRRGGIYREVRPAIEITYLGRDCKWKFREIGVRLVLHALNVALDMQDAVGGFVGVQLTTTEKGRHLYISDEIGFNRHPVGNHSADLFKPMKDIYLLESRAGSSVMAVSRGDYLLLLLLGYAECVLPLSRPVSACPVRYYRPTPQNRP